MKKILLVNKSFETGGIQSSLINMANELCGYYDVDLYIYNPTGALKDRLNDKVTVLEPSWRFKAIGSSVSELLHSHNIKGLIFKLFASVWTKAFGNRLPIEIAIKHQKTLKGYDLAVAYHQEQRKKAVISGFTRFVDRCVEAKTKAAWLHFDSDTIDLDSEYNNEFYSKMDKLFCVSKSLKSNFAKNNPELASKTDYCYNFMLYDLMQEKSKLSQEVSFEDGKTICFSACRLAREKALPRAICAVSEIFESNPDVMWYIAGDGPERSNIEEAINTCKLQGRVILIGNQSNPYPYMKNADLVINVSYHEAAPMTFFEAKAMGTPVFATRTSSAEELLCDGVDSFICENSENGIKEKFAWLMDNKDEIKKAKAQLVNHIASNKESLEKIEELLN